MGNSLIVQRTSREKEKVEIRKRMFSTAPIIDRQLARQKISVIKTNSSDDIKKIVHFGILIHVLS
jgi:hypothetical protein